MTNKNLLKILFVEDLSSDVDLAVLELRKEKLTFEHITVCTREDLINALNEFKPDLIISDYLMPAFNGLQALMVAKEFDPEIPFILCTGSVNEETAVECIKAGAQDYVIKEHMTRLPFAVKEALEQVRIQKEKRASDLLLKESEEKIQSIFAVAPVGVGLVVDRILMEVNDYFCQMTGYKRNELIGKTSELLYQSREEFEKVGTVKYRQIEEKGTGSIETIFKCKDGTLLNIILSSAPLDVTDHSRGVTFTALDITDRKKIEVALKESEEKFRSIAENLSDVIFITDTNGNIKYVSPSSAILGYSPETYIGRFFVDFLTDGENEKAMSFFKNALNSVNVSNSVSLIFKHKDGRNLYAEVSGSVFKTGNEITGVLGLLRDVSDKVNREIELRKLSLAVEQNPASILITNTDGLIEYVNPKLCNITGYSKEELIGLNPRILSSGEKSKEEYKVLWDTIKAGNEWKGEFHNKKKNGDLFWENAAISPIKNEMGKITHYLGTKEDITDKKIMEAAVVANEQRYRELFLNTPAPTYIFDTRTLEFIEVNDATVLSYGYTRDEFASMTLKDLRREDEIHQLIESVNQLRKDTFHSTSIHHRRKDGTMFPVEIFSHALPEKNGRSMRLVMATDITERVRASEQMKLAKEKAEKSDKLKTSFLNNISHEVRTPLNGILGFAELISQTNLSDEERKDSLFMLHESSDRLLNTITNYMDISLITSGSLTVHKKDFLPASHLRSVFEDYKEICSAKDLELVLHIPEFTEDLTLNSDPEIFHKILAHLLNNAIKFTQKGTISYGYFAKEEFIEVFVKDTGVGIGNESLDLVFDFFVKEDRGPLMITEGSGLGLSIAKGMIDVIGGEIRVESQLGAGSCFYFTIPYMKDNLLGTTVISGIEHKLKLAGASILIAEDDETNFYYLNTLLTREKVAKIYHASNGREAIELFMMNPDIQLILMDIKMPEIDGLEATRQIKLLNSAVPIIAITAYAMSGDEDRVLAAGCDGYLSKPISKSILLKKLEEFIKT
jgi:PAS domain S-box-containing protein